MPELPDLTIYQERLLAKAGGSELARLHIGNPFVLRTIDPKPVDFAGKRLRAVNRIGKRLVLEFEGELFAAIHLMILGRLHWRAAAQPGRWSRSALFAFEFENGALVLTESGTKRRASLHLLRGAAALAQFDRGGLEVPGSSLDAFGDALRRENQTVKRALTDPTVLAGVGNAYSDEILHRARLSPFKKTQDLSAEEMKRLHDAARSVLAEWTHWLREEAGDGWPEKVTAFRKGMAVHGRFGQPCPECGAPVQRVVYAANEMNYCARCQTEGRLLADRALSRLLKESWPRNIDEVGE